MFPENFIILSQDTLKIAKQFKDSAELNFQIVTISIEGNQKTRDLIILRELTFKQGDTLGKPKLQEAIEQSTTNLLKLPLFNYVTIESLPSGENRLNIKIIVEERWFIWPQLAILNNERNFNNWFKERDLSKLDYRVAVKKYNVFGLNHIFRVGLSYGYTKELSLSYQNIALDKKQKHLIGFYSSYSEYNSVFFRTFKNKQESFTNEESNVLVVKYFGFNYLFRPLIHYIHRFRANLQCINVSDSINIANPGYIAGEENQNSYMELMYQFIIDKRDSRSYPLTGFWLDASVTKTGLNLKKESQVDFLNIKSSIKQYYCIAERFYGAHSLTIKKSFDKFLPYFYKENLGYDDFLRGFEYYVIEGEDYYLFKNVLKFELLPKKISYFNFIPIKKFKKIHYAFYTNLFFDLGYANEKNPEEILENTLSNKLLFSGGLGIDLVTYYDKVLRIEYSINSLKESGLFFHFTAPI